MENKDFEAKLDQTANDAYDEEMKNINDQLDKEIVFAMIGEVNSGKSSTVNQLLQEEVASVGPAPGETIVIRKYKYKGKDKIIFADTPGLNDINKDNSEETKQFFKETDIILFFLNAAGTVFSEREKNVFEKLKELNNNIIFVLNKIDAAEDIDSLIDYIKLHTESKYKIVPISSRTGENIELLNNAILEILKKKRKDILYAKNLKEKSSVANKWILTASTSAGAVGGLPVPGADFVPITAIQVGLLVRLATLYDKPLSKKNAKELTIATITGNIGKSLFRQIVKVVPGAGSIAGAGVASGMTLALGHAVKYGYENEIAINTDTLKILYQEYLKKNPKNKQEYTKIDRN